ncbi:hypothetical protein FAZ19_15895 [Sphingobacterium alkalisoli]|uniref:Uncharacterized protein n=1 Tax=Sphingobacterium alkalisoli TaxID=1874115 RepID=A0A4V5LY76_9SPHI|nr:hypothetical protein [Sphingobacterium alkalisoli]TJY63749.1 hypothetical protein FAZ19_15895 [Sphingobacterium alkalisoli]
MKPKTIIIAVLLAIVVIVLFNNKEESSFWFFGDIRTSKLLILGVFFLIGVITGGVLFRRKKVHPKEYGITNPNAPFTPTALDEHPYSPSNLSDEDREYIRRD